MTIEWPLVLFSMLAGCGGCTFAYVAIADLLKCGRTQRFVTTIVALVLTIVGGCCSVAHLASPGNVMAAVWNLGSFSGISIELLLIGITCILMAVFLVLTYREQSGSAITGVGIAGGIFGLLLAFFTGHGYVLESQIAWNTEVLPFAYLGTSLAVGAFVYIVCGVCLKTSSEDLEKMATPAGIGAIIGALSIVAYIAVVGIEPNLENPFMIWGGLVLCGIVLTAACGVVFLVRKKSVDSFAVPCVGLAVSAVGAIALRSFMWLMGSGFLSLFDVASGSRVLFGF